MELIKAAASKGWLKIVERCVKNRQGFKLVMPKSKFVGLLNKGSVVGLPWPILKPNQEALTKTVLAIFKNVASSVGAYYAYRLVEQLSNQKYRFRVVQKEDTGDLVIEAIPTYPE